LALIIVFIYNSLLIHFEFFIFLKSFVLIVIITSWHYLISTFVFPPSFEQLLSFNFYLPENFVIPYPFHSPTTISIIQYQHSTCYFIQFLFPYSTNLINYFPYLLASCHYQCNH